MEKYRSLTIEEIKTLEKRGCKAEDWSAVSVANDFKAETVRNVSFYGEVTLGVFEKKMEVSKGFFKTCGIKNATLRNVEIGDNCLIENIGNYINNYIIGEECYISNVNTMETTDGATFGQGNMISVLNEAGDGNVMLFDGLTSQLAALMVNHHKDKELITAMKALIRKEIMESIPDRGTIGFGVKIVNTSEITNTNINDDCEVIGACRLSDCSIKSIPEASVYIGSGVICENSIIFDGSSILNSVKLENCFVGEACHITNGFTAESSIFFANSYMANGEACAAFCGPFSASHHKACFLFTMRALPLTSATMHTRWVQFTMALLKEVRKLHLGHICSCLPTLVRSRFASENSCTILTQETCRSHILLLMATRCISHQAETLPPWDSIAI